MTSEIGTTSLQDTNCCSHSSPSSEVPLHTHIFAQRTGIDTLSISIDVHIHNKAVAGQSKQVNYTQGQLLKGKRAALGGIRTHDTMQSRRSTSPTQMQHVDVAGQWHNANDIHDYSFGKRCCLGWSSNPPQSVF